MSVSGSSIMLSAILCVLGIIVIILRSLKKYEGKNEVRKRIPGPIQLPLVGTKWKLCFIKINKLHEHYAALNSKYGDVVMELNGKFPVISLFNLKDIEKMLKYPAKYPFRPPNEIVAYFRSMHPERYNSAGIVNAQGPEWHFLRSKLVPKFLQNYNSVASFCPQLNQISDSFINSLQQGRNHELVFKNVDYALKSLAFKNIMLLAVGEHFDEKEALFQKFHAASNCIFEAQRSSFFGIGWWKYFSTKNYKNLAESEAILYDAASELLRSKKFLKNDDKSTILRSLQDQEDLDDRDKILGLLEFILGGIDVLAYTILILLHFLTINPEAQDKIYEEVVSMDEQLTSENLRKASYTRAAIHEAFRLCPCAFVISRILEEDMIFSGYTVKAGSLVMCQNMIACNKEENFEDATEYKPERWRNETGTFDSNLCKASSLVKQFGSGKRICPGRKFVELEIAIFIVKLVRKFKFKYLSDFETDLVFMLAPKTPIDLQIVDRLATL